MLKKLFDEVAIDKKNVISIYTLISQIYVAKNPNKYFTSKNKNEKLKLEPLELFEIFATD